MPFTPYHMGPGLLVKACMQGAFSLVVFGWAQILIDIEPLVAMIRQSGDLHGFSHTFPGATLIAPLAAVSGKYLGEMGLRVIQMSAWNPIGWRVAIVSAFIGTYSHVLLDSVMHADMQPFAPFSSANPMLGLLRMQALHLFCLASAVLGAIGFLAVLWYRRRQQGAASAGDQR